MADLVIFFVTVSEDDGVAPAMGERILVDYYQEYIARYLQDK